MKIVSVEENLQNKWEDFIKDNSTDFGLLQSWGWGEFQKVLGRKIFRLVVVEQDQIMAVALVIKMPLGFGKFYFYIPRGPILLDNTGLVDSQYDVLTSLFAHLELLAKKEGAIFLRFDPAWQDNEQVAAIMNDFGFISAGQVQPKGTLILNLGASEEELLAQMKSKTRYNIRVAEKHGVEVDEGDGYFDDFWRLIQKTSDRQEISSHSKKYYQGILQSCSDKQSVFLAVAKHQGNVVAANMMVFFGDWLVYLHGGSDYRFRNLMAPYLLQWEMIKKAKHQGRKFYDFWGVDKEKWPGVTRFKLGFNPTASVTKYIGAWDAVYRPLWYNLYKLASKIKR